jgi:CRISPR-associated endonuclease/helicase Cas3
MSSLSPDQFEDFYRAANGNKSPFPWQKRLAARVCESGWPRAIALPTAAGKTACIDIALFALACGVKGAPRRIFFVVDRRIVVDQAYRHSLHLAKVLKDRDSDILATVADALLKIADPSGMINGKKDRKDVRPLDVYALRGGMYRENAWARSPLQPTVIASTVDQVGSRLLFRGYGVSDSMKPVHAGLVGNDALVLLDEAHCAKPFDQTMQAVAHYRSWAETDQVPFGFVSITATPTGEIPEEQIVRDSAEDRSHPVLGSRLNAGKPARLVVAAKAKGKNARPELVKVLEHQARDLAKEFACVGIIVNSVATARQLKEKLADEAELLTGRMRPLDRDRLFEERLKPLLSGGSGQPPKFVVGTQCLECGADFDFHALVTECASLDALRQRFGRLNRIAARGSARAVVVVRADQVEDSSADYVYGQSLANTWKWMNEKADGHSESDGNWIDFGVSSIRRKWDETPPDAQAGVVAPSPDAPVLFPAHLDCWVQTNPVPVPDPDPALFLHGPEQKGQPDIKVVFRSDLGEDAEQWTEIVALCPPSSSEAVEVPISVFRKWLGAELYEDETADVEGGGPATEDEAEPRTSGRLALCWRGAAKSYLVTDAKQVKPNETYVVLIPPLSEESERASLRQLADFDPALRDYGEEAFQRSRDKALLRLTPAVVENWPFRTPKLTELTAITEDFEDRDEAANLLDEVLDELVLAVNSEGSGAWKWLGLAAEKLRREEGERGRARDRECSNHPRGGIVVAGKVRLHQFDPTYLDDTEPEESFRGRAVPLEEHSRGVAHYAASFAEACRLPAEIYDQAGLWHDLGKLDPRFQAMLKGCSPRTAVGKPLAKSGRAAATRAERELARQVHCYPSGARHELLSTAIVAGRSNDDLLLHLIATHHGSARPFAGPVGDEPTEQEARGLLNPELFAEKFQPISPRQQIEAWNAELPERFWRIVRKFGWWGAAYRETVFRLADHWQSAAEQEGTKTPDREAPAVWKGEDAPDRSPPVGLPLTGMDGSNPLAFLAAIGTLTALDRLSRADDRPAWLMTPPRLSWGTSASRQTPVLWLSKPATPDLAAYLHEHLARTLDQHPAALVVELLRNNERPLPNLIRECCRNRSVVERPRLDWVTALACDLAPEATSQLQTVRRDYLIGNLESVIQRTSRDHLQRTLFETWDYRDALNNQSLHWEPSEDRRHAYQWYQPNGDPTRNRRGGMLGANRLAMEAWALLPSFPSSRGDKLVTRGFQGTSMYDTFWTWPLWQSPLTVDGVASILGLPAFQSEDTSLERLREFGVTMVFRAQRILVGKTPNLTPATALA